MFDDIALILLHKFNEESTTFNLNCRSVNQDNERDFSEYIRNMIITSNKLNLDLLLRNHVIGEVKNNSQHVSYEHGNLDRCTKKQLPSTCFENTKFMK